MSASANGFIMQVNMPIYVLRLKAQIIRSTHQCCINMQIITPTDLFYVRNHLPVPEVDASSWKLKIKASSEACGALSSTYVHLQQV
jgi:hypothetical protein